MPQQQPAVEGATGIRVGQAGKGSEGRSKGGPRWLTFWVHPQDTHEALELAKAAQHRLGPGSALAAPQIPLHLQQAVLEHLPRLAGRASKRQPVAPSHPAPNG